MANRVCHPVSVGQGGAAPCLGAWVPAKPRPSSIATQERRHRQRHPACLELMHLVVTSCVAVIGQAAHHLRAHPGSTSTQWSGRAAWQQACASAGLGQAEAWVQWAVPRGEKVELQGAGRRLAGVTGPERLAEGWAVCQKGPGWAGVQALAGSRTSAPVTVVFGHGRGFS